MPNPAIFPTQVTKTGFAQPEIMRLQLKMDKVLELLEQKSGGADGSSSEERTRSAAAFF